MIEAKYILALCDRFEPYLIPLDIHSLRQRYNGKTFKSTDTVGREMGISDETVRTIENRALDAIAHGLDLEDNGQDITPMRLAKSFRQPVASSICDGGTHWVSTAAYTAHRGELIIFASSIPRERSPFSDPLYTLLSAKFWGSQQGWPWKNTAVCCGNAHAPAHFSDFHAMDLAYWRDISHPVLLHFRGNARISEAAWVFDLAESRAIGHYIIPKPDKNIPLGRSSAAASWLIVLGISYPNPSRHKWRLTLRQPEAFPDPIPYSGRPSSFYINNEVAQQLPTRYAYSLKRA